jgi:biopolymer transport protein ExbD
MDVLMTVLTFFIIVSMTLTNQQGSLDIELPPTQSAAGATKENVPDPLFIGINKDGEILILNQRVTKEKMAQEIQLYLTAKPEGAVILKADRKLSYEKVIEILGEMKEIGGDRVSLAIDQK